MDRQPAPHGGDPAAAPGYQVVRTQVRWGDCDPAGIAFFPRFFEWMDLASHALAREMGITREDVLGPASYGFPAIHAQAEFLVPALLDDEIEVRTTIVHVGRTSLRMRHQLVRMSDGVLLARGEAVRVHIQRVPSRAMRPVPLTPAMRRVLSRYVPAEL